MLGYTADAAHSLTVIFESNKNLPESIFASVNLKNFGFLKELLLHRLIQSNATKPPTRNNQPHFNCNLMK